MDEHRSGHTPDYAWPAGGRGQLGETRESVCARTELVAIEEEMFRAHLDAWIDEKVPTLGNRTPRVVRRRLGIDV